MPDLVLCRTGAALDDVFDAVFVLSAQADKRKQVIVSIQNNVRFIKISFSMCFLFKYSIKKYVVNGCLSLNNCRSSQKGNACHKKATFVTKLLIFGNGVLYLNKYF